MPVSTKSSPSVISVNENVDPGTCQGCGVRTHKAKNSKPVTNAHVYQGICIKCRPDEVPQNVLDALDAYYTRLNQPAANADTESLNSHAANKCNFSRTTVITSDNEIRHPGTCLDCGIRTHKIKAFSTKPITNALAYKGVCIACNPDRVPQSVRDAFEARENKEKKKAVANKSVASNLKKPIEIEDPASTEPAKGVSLTDDVSDISTELETSIENSVEENSLVSETTFDSSFGATAAYCDEADPVYDSTKGRRRSTSKYLAGAAVASAAAAAALFFLSDGAASKGWSLRKSQTRVA